MELTASTKIERGQFVYLSPLSKTLRAVTKSIHAKRRIIGVARRSIDKGEVVSVGSTDKDDVATAGKVYHV